MNGGAEFPPVVVFFDGTNHWLADGFHRVHARKKTGHGDIPADIHQGTKRDAILHSLGANASHGMRRSNEDKRRAVERMLTDRQWRKWSDQDIARQCAVSAQMVGVHRKRLVDASRVSTPHRLPISVGDGIADGVNGWRCGASVVGLRGTSRTASCAASSATAARRAG